MTHNQLVLAHLRRASIDPLLALDALGVYRLGARIFDLRAAGHDIASTIVEVRNRRGEVCRVARYTLTREARA